MTGGKSEPTEHGAEGPDEVVAPTYRPALDGLRTVAVYLVVAFHAGSHRFEGGFIGVDVFFVLSGYLVTLSLLRGRAAGGRGRLGSFYLRRVRRLAPAALVNLVVTGFVFAALATPVELDAARDSMRAAALWFSNWHFIGTGSDYFGPDITSNPVAHYWSLSIEEQFYLVWPILLATLVAVGRTVHRGRRTPQLLVALLAAASLAGALVVAGDDVDRAYYGTDTRAYQLLLGALLALTPGLVGMLAARRGAVRAVSWAGPVVLVALVAAASSLVSPGPVSRGAVAAVLTAAVILALESAPAAPIGRLLSLAPVVYLGRISYGTYLWHWIVVLVIDRSFEMASATRFLVVALVASGLASLSHHLVEMPIRSLPVSSRWARPGVAVGVAASLLVGLVVAPRILEAGRPEQRASTVRAEGIVGTPNDVDLSRLVEDLEEALRPCEEEGTGACHQVDGTGATILLVGDSNALAASRMMEGVAEAHDLDLYAWGRAGCSWARGIRYPTVESESCFDDQDDLYDTVLPRLDPDVVVLVHRVIPDRDDAFGVEDVDAGPLTEGSESRDRRLAQRARETVDRIRASAEDVVVIEPLPVSVPGHDPARCLADAEVLEECRYVAPTTPTGMEVVYREMAAEVPGVWALDIDPLVCPFLPICDPVVNGEPVLLDAHHLALGFAATLSDPVARRLVELEVIR